MTCIKFVKSLRFLSGRVSEIWESIIIIVLSVGVGLRDEHTLMMLESRVLMKIYRPKREEVNGYRRKFHNKGLHDCTHQMLFG